MHINNTSYFEKVDCRPNALCILFSGSRLGKHDHRIVFTSRAEQMPWQ